MAQDLTTDGTPTVAGAQINGNAYINGRVRGERSILYVTTDDFDVSNITLLNVNSSGGSVNINGLSGGYSSDGLKQILFLSKVSGANTVTIVHNSGTGTQKILTPDGLDIDLQTYAGRVLLYDGTYWRVIKSA